jgi:hypothetical protein
MTFRTLLQEEISFENNQLNETYDQQNYYNRSFKST